MKAAFISAKIRNMGFIACHPKGQDMIDCGQGFRSEFIRLSEPAGTSLPWEFDIIPKENEIEHAYVLKESLKH